MFAASILRRIVLAPFFAVGIVASLCTIALAQTDPLPSWNDGTVKKSIADFVVRVTTQGGPDFVPAPERIATFDNDGTLWTEQPYYFQLAFALDRIKAMAPQHPEWKNKQPFKALLDDDKQALAAAGKDGLLQIVAATHAGMTIEEFSKAVIDWTETARHPRFNRRYTELVYQPMLELLVYLRANDFKTFIVSGGGIEFMRPWTERVYGIPPEQVVGSSGMVKYRIGANGRPELLKLAEIEFVDDGPGKPVGINRFIGTAADLRIRKFRRRSCDVAMDHGGGRGCVSPVSYTIPMPSANTPTTGNRRSASWTRRWTRPQQRVGPSWI